MKMAPVSGGLLGDSGGIIRVGAGPRAQDTISTG